MYVNSGSDGTFGIYSVAQDTGALEELDRVLVGASSSTEDLQLDASGRFLFATTSDGSVSSFAIEEDGLLRLIDSAPSGESPKAIAVAPSGSSLYISSESGNISAHAIDPEGFLGTARSVAAGTEASSIAIDPSGRFAYVLSPEVSSVRVLAYSIHSQTGELTSEESPTALPGYATSLAISPDGRFLYCTDTTGAAVSGFEINRDHGALAAMTESFVAGTSPVGITVVSLTG